MLKGYMLAIFAVLVVSVILAMATTALILKRRAADRPAE
jgi:putative effector of murein hydrolase LrgA (UPF0299 family)